MSVLLRCSGLLVAQQAAKERRSHSDTDPLRKAVNSIGATIYAAMRVGSDSREVVALLNRRG
jgi:hypothetical protein